MADELIAGVDYEVAVCDNCGLVDHTPKQLVVCTISVLGPPRTEERMTMVNTDTPGVTAEVTSTVPVTNHAAQVRFQSWAQRFGDDDGDGSHERLVDLRFTPDQAEDIASALNAFAHMARIDNANHGQPRLDV